MMGNASDVTFDYNADSELTRFLHAGDLEIAEYAGDGTLLRRYIPGGAVDQRVAMVEGASVTPAPSDLRYYHADRLGNVAALTDGTGRVTDRYAYDPFGNEITGAATSGNPFRYTGRRYDPETGLYFYRARYYDAPLGRFLQTDPIGYDDQWNLYTYVGNNPLNLVDPTGTEDDVPFSTQFFNFASGDREARDRTLTEQSQPDRSLGERIDSGINKTEINLGIASHEIAIGAENAANSAVNAAIEGVGGFGALRGARAFGAAAKLCCFVAGTEVLTDQGLRPIEDIVVGDLVMARDEVTGEEAFQPVTELTRRHDKIIWAVRTADQNGVEEVFQTTGDHPWWVAGEGWVRTHALVSGVKLSTFSGVEITLLSVENTGEVQPTYNFEVDGFASYFVGKSQIWVHNGPSTSAAAKRLGINLNDISINDGVANIRIRQTRVFTLGDIKAINSHLKGLGATDVLINSGKLADAGLAQSLAKRADSGQGFAGLDVFRTGNPDNAFILTGKVQ